MNGAVQDNSGRKGGATGNPLDPAGVLDLTENDDEEYEDLGDIALAAVALSRRPPSVELPPPQICLPPEVEARLAYYEAKLRYLAKQNEAHGASASRIQARFRTGQNGG